MPHWPFTHNWLFDDTFLRRIAIVFIGFSCVAGVLLFPFSSRGEWFDELQNAGHGIGFAVITAACLGLLTHSRSVFKAAAVAVAILLCGVLIEIGQGWVGRTPSVGDAVANGVGVFAGVSWSLATYSRRWRHTLRVLAVALPSLAALPHLPLPLAQLSRPSFPSIENFRGSFAVHRIEGTYGSAVEVAKNRDASAPMRLVLGDGAFPGVRLLDVVADWRGFQSLCVVLEVSVGNSLRLNLRIHDATHDSRREDRFSRRYELPQGPHVLHVELEDIERMGQRAPERLMDLSKVAGVMLFSRPDHVGRVLGLDGIWLTHDGRCTRTSSA